MEKMDAYKSFELAQKLVDKAFKDGKIPRERAKQVLEGARKNYGNQSYNRQIEKYEHRN